MRPHGHPPELRPAARRAHRGSPRAEHPHGARGRCGIHPAEHPHHDRDHCDTHHAEHPRWGADRCDTRREERHRASPGRSGTRPASRHPAAHDRSDIRPVTHRCAVHRRHCRSHGSHPNVRRPDLRLHGIRLHGERGRYGIRRVVHPDAELDRRCDHPRSRRRSCRGIRRAAPSRGCHGSRHADRHLAQDDNHQIAHHPVVPAHYDNHPSARRPGRPLGVCGRRDSHHRRAGRRARCRRVRPGKGGPMRCRIGERRSRGHHPSVHRMRRPDCRRCARLAGRLPVYRSRLLLLGGGPVAQPMSSVVWSVWCCGWC